MLITNTHNVGIDIKYSNVGLKNTENDGFESKYGFIIMFVGY